MVEKALLYAMVAAALVGAASLVSTAFHKTVDRIECGIERASVCILDDGKEG